MNETNIAKLLELIGELVRSDGPWVDKKAAILSVAAQEDLTNLEEFAGWFEAE